MFFNFKRINEKKNTFQELKREREVLLNDFEKNNRILLLKHDLVNNFSINFFISIKFN
jgi:hypothetical protein